MIEGAVNARTRQPTVEVEVWVPALGSRRDVRFGLDLVAGRTSLAFADLELDPPSLPPPDDAALLDLPGGRLVVGMALAAILRFEHDDGRPAAVLCELVLLDGPPRQARLGLDVLRSMLIVYDPGGETVLLEPVG